MLSPILKRSDCAACRFCCSFKRTSVWEIPIFTAENIEAISSVHPELLSCLHSFEHEGLVYARYDLSGYYCFDNADEEAPCPFLDPSSGCILSPEEKPWDCRIWPLRVVRPQGSAPFISLTPTCPAINRLGKDAVRSFVKDGLEDELLQYASMHPCLYKTDRDGFLEPLMD